MIRFVPLALNHLGLRGPHFQAVLKVFAIVLVIKPEGCSLLHGPFALITHSGALHKIIITWGSRLTCTTQRGPASRFVMRMYSFYDIAAVAMQWGGGGGLDVV